MDDDHFLSGDSDGNIHVLSRNLPGCADEPVIVSMRHARLNPSPPVPTSSTAAAPAAAASGGDVASTSTAVAQASTSGAAVNPQTPIPACVSVDSKSLIDCAYMHTGESINVFARGKGKSRKIKASSSPR